jgi:hypothetical protein
MFESQGRKEVGEAVLIATLCALTVGCVNLGIKEVKAWLQRSRDRREKKRQESERASCDT